MFNFPKLKKTLQEESNLDNENIAEYPGSFAVIYTKTAVFLIIYGYKLHEIKSKGKLMSRNFWSRERIFMQEVQRQPKKDFIRFINARIDLPLLFVPPA